MSFQNYLCQVSGCTVDLRKEGQPGLKLRTCEAHRKSGSVVVDGVPSRYCQQCVKLHPLDEFDGEKRGCRRRLESHNRRYGLGASSSQPCRCRPLRSCGMRASSPCAVPHPSPYRRRKQKSTLRRQESEVKQNHEVVVIAS